MSSGAFLSLQSKDEIILRMETCNFLSTFQSFRIRNEGIEKSTIGENLYGKFSQKWLDIPEVFFMLQHLNTDITSTRHFQPPVCKDKENARKCGPDRSKNSLKLICLCKHVQICTKFLCGIAICYFNVIYNPVYILSHQRGKHGIIFKDF